VSEQRFWEWPLVSLDISTTLPYTLAVMRVSEPGMPGIPGDYWRSVFVTGFNFVKFVLHLGFQTLQSMKDTFNVFAYSYKMKVVGILLICWGIYSCYAKYRQFDLIDLNLLAGISCWGLVFIFFSKEKIDDERIHQLKFQALTWAVPVGLCITHLLNYLFLSSPDRNSGQLFDSISAYQSLVMMLLLSLGLFHYLKHKN
jgi:hypothetical protein